jgi:surface antigen
VKKMLLVPVAAGLMLTGCSMHEGSQNEVGGTAVGAIGGGTLGGLIGGTATNSTAGAVAGIGIGAILGSIIGNRVGASMDRADQAAMQRASNQSISNDQRASWDNSQSNGHSGWVETIDRYRDDYNRPCVVQRHHIYVKGRERVVDQTMCRINGRWTPLK